MLSLSLSLDSVEVGMLSWEHELATPSIAMLSLSLSLYSVEVGMLSCEHGLATPSIAMLSLFPFFRFC